MQAVTERTTGGTSVGAMTAARNAVNAAEAVAPRTWAEIQAEFEEAEAASDRAFEYEYEAESDEPEYERRQAANKQIYERYKAARAELLGARAAHWAGVAAKIGPTLTQFGSGDESDAPWCQSARELRHILLEIGDGAPGDAPTGLVIKARLHAESMAYRAANEPGGYGAWGCNIRALADHACAIESIVGDTRALSKFNMDHRLTSGEATNTVWFWPAHLDCQVSSLSAEMFDALSTFEEHDTKDTSALSPKDALAYSRADHDLTAIPSAALRMTPASKGGVAFQLVAAMGQLHAVQHAVSDDADDAANLIRSAVANAIRVLDLPITPLVAKFFMGDALGDDGARPEGGQ